MKTHSIKSWPKFFIPISCGERTHELRRDDRNYEVGDWLHLNEFDPGSGNFTGRSCMVKITSLTSANEPCAVSKEALHGDFCILSVKLVDR